MSKPKASGGNESAAGQEPSFEEALKKLESIVEAMESSDLPLETLLRRCEEGAVLAQHCQARLADAELKIQQLERTLGGQILAKPVSIADDPASA